MGLQRAIERGQSSLLSRLLEDHHEEEEEEEDEPDGALARPVDDVVQL